MDSLVEEETFFEEDAVFVWLVLVNVFDRFYDLITVDGLGRFVFRFLFFFSLWVGLDTAWVVRAVECDVEIAG